MGPSTIIEPNEALIGIPYPTNVTPLSLPDNCAEMMTLLQASVENESDKKDVDVFSAFNAIAIEGAGVGLATEPRPRVGVIVGLAAETELGAVEGTEFGGVVGALAAETELGAVEGTEFGGVVGALAVEIEVGAVVETELGFVVRTELGVVVGLRDEPERGGGVGLPAEPRFRWAVALAPGGRESK